MFDSLINKQMTFTAAQQISSRFDVPHRYVGAAMLAALLASAVQAQTTTEPAASAPAQAATPVQVAPPAAPTVSAAPKYAAKDIERAFGFIDTNKDSKISREEAAGFRGVAKHFDEADSNKDNALSREEFENALSGEKKR